MIGDRQDGEACLSVDPDDLLWMVTTVALNRMDVKVCLVVGERRPIDPFIWIRHFWSLGESARTTKNADEQQDSEGR
jgi:hypothetical protein